MTKLLNMVCYVVKRRGQELYQSRNVNWLLNNAGPIIRYRIITEFDIGMTESDKKDATKELLECEEVRKWIRLLKESTHIHSSNDLASENCLANLTAYGVTAGMGPVSNILRSVHSNQYENIPHHKNAITRILVPFLISIELSDEHDVLEYAKGRLLTVYGYAERSLSDFSQNDDVSDLMLSQTEKAALHVPKKWRTKYVWKPELMHFFPNCYDFYLFAFLHGYDDERATILRFVHTLKYQRLCELREFHGSYGWDENKKYCWSAAQMPFLHGYFGFDSSQFSPNKFLLYLDLASRFPNAKEIGWFRRGLESLDIYRTDTGRYCFPSQYIPERKNGYYLYAGARMRLGEHGRLGLEIESTFRMERMKRSLGEER